MLKLKLDNVMDIFNQIIFKKFELSRLAIYVKVFSICFRFTGLLSHQSCTCITLFYLVLHYFYYYFFKYSSFATLFI